MATPIMIRLVVPTLVNVTVWAGVVVNSNTEPKFRLVGESFGVVPIPLRLTFCGQTADANAAPTCLPPRLWLQD